MGAQAPRDGIRKTWFRFHGVGRWTLACFVVGRIGVKKKDLAKLDAEAAVHGDVIFLRGTQDGRGPFVTISKLHAWFRLASELLGLIDRGPDAASMEDEVALLKPDSPRKPITTGPLGASVRHIAKVDDDTFIHLPVMQRTSTRSIASTISTMASSRTAATTQSPLQNAALTMAWAPLPTV